MSLEVIQVEQKVLGINIQANTTQDRKFRGFVGTLSLRDSIRPVTRQNQQNTVEFTQAHTICNVLTLLYTPLAFVQYRMTILTWAIRIPMVIFIDLPC